MTDAPKPMPPKPKPLAVIEEETDLKVIVAKDKKSEVKKPPFVLKPHLTERPLRGHEGLVAMLKNMEASSTKRVGQRRRNNKEKK